MWYTGARVCASAGGIQPDACTYWLALQPANRSVAMISLLVSHPEIRPDSVTLCILCISMIWTTEELRRDLSRDLSLVGKYIAASAVVKKPPAEPKQGSVCCAFPHCKEKVLGDRSSRVIINLNTHWKEHSKEIQAREEASQAGQGSKQQPASVITITSDSDSEREGSMVGQSDSIPLCPTL